MSAGKPAHSANPWRMYRECRYAGNQARLGKSVDRRYLGAQREFERYSYGGARMQRIADTAGVPKANVHYYFGNKQELYNAVLEEVVELWDLAFESINPEDDPATVLDNFVRRKVEFTRLYPEATRIFVSEMLHGAPHLSRHLNQRMSRWTRERAEVIRKWVALGKIRPVDPYHLIFMIWSSTQHYACTPTQIKSVLDKSRLTRKDYERQAESLSQMVMRICGLDAP